MNHKRYQEVMDMLDEQASPKNMNFPAFGAGLYYVDSRLTVYANEEHWGILIEVIEISGGGIGHPRNLNDIYRYGNCCRNKVGIKNNRSIAITSDGAEGETFNKKTEYLEPNVKTIRIRNNSVPIPLDLNIYTNKGIALESKDKISPKELLRAFTPEYRHHFFLNDEEKQAEFIYPIPKLLQLDEWNHPQYDEENILEPPSQCEAFQMIAKVIATCDSNLYKPTEAPNTHWKNWLIADKYL